MKRNYLSVYVSPQLGTCRIMPERGFAVSGDESGSSLEDVEDETIDNWI